MDSTVGVTWLRACVRNNVTGQTFSVSYTAEGHANYWHIGKNDTVQVRGRQSHFLRLAGPVLGHRLQTGADGTTETAGCTHPERGGAAQARTG